MKTLVLVASVLLVSMTNSCNKNDGNKSVIATESTQTNDREEKTERYVAEDGSSAHVTFITEDGQKSISVRSNNKTIAAPQKEEGVYGNYDFEIVAKNDSVTITQGNNVIRLKKARGQ